MNASSKRTALPVLISLSMAWPASVAAYCLDGKELGLFTERAFTELDAPPRNMAQDKRLNALMKRGMKATGARLVSVEGETVKQALQTADDQGLPVLAFLELEATSSQSPLPGPVLDIASTATLQLVAVPGGQVLGEGSDLGETPGVNIEDALPAILSIKTVETLAVQAEREACDHGLPTMQQAVAEVSANAATVSTSAVYRTLVAQIQHALIAAGYHPGQPDGVIGPETVDAIKQAEMTLKRAPTGQPSSSLLHQLGALDRALIGDVQQALYDLGRLDSRPTRVLDRITEGAIETAEYDFGLEPADGLPDQDLLRVLRAQKPAQVDAALTTHFDSDETALRKRVEDLLVQLGYFDGPATGVYTMDSEHAIWRAERDFGLEADGRPDRELWRLLQAKVDG